MILALSTLFALCACSSGEQAQPTAAPAEQTPQPEQPNVAAEEEQTAALNALLEGFATGIQAGSVGSSLKAVSQAAKLLDWGMSTGMTDEQISAAVDAYLGEMDDAARSEYLMQIESLDYAYKQLLQPGQEELLAEAGCADAAYPWSDSPVPSVESLMAALGMR